MNANDHANVKRIYVICPVRGVSGAEADYVAQRVGEWEGEGFIVHYPPRDVSQNDPTGSAICEAHYDAMREADAVAVFWNVESKGSHFDLGMAYALGKPLFYAHLFGKETEGKSYWKVIREWDA